MGSRRRRSRGFEWLGGEHDRDKRKREEDGIRRAMNIDAAWEEKRRIERDMAKGNR